MAQPQEGRYVPADTNGGWGVAAFIMLLTAICIATAAYIHHESYLHPQDVRWHAKGQPIVQDE
jgi:hypothetical protein